MHSQAHASDRGARENIIPDQVEMSGPIRIFDEDMRTEVHTRITQIAVAVAAANGATAEVRIEKAVPVTPNDEALTERALPSLKRVATATGLRAQRRAMVAEDFCYFQQKVTGVFFFVGVTQKDQGMGGAAPNHSPRFYIDESALLPGRRALRAVAFDYLTTRSR